MRGVHLCAAAVVLGIGAGGAALANDSTATLGAGGLVLTESADIRMASEDLHISRKIVRVRYSFINDSAEPITTRVAFPLPDADFESLADTQVAWPSADSGNVVGFKVTIDGKAVKPELERKAVYQGEDVTAVLKRLGVPLAYRGHELGEALKDLPEAAQAELIERGLAQISEHHASAAWTLKSTFHWRQTFPAGRPVTVEHEYRPVAGAAFTNPETYASDMERYDEEYCLDDATRAGIARRLNEEKAREGDTAMLMLYFVDYVLTTGRNWKGPIGKFRLTIDKGHPKNLLSLCMEGVRKTGPTTFMVERTDFEPDRDLSLMFIEPPAQ